MRLEKRKELKEYTWNAMRPSEMEVPAAQSVLSASMRVLVVLVVVIPRKRAKVKRELTLTMPSKAIM